MYSSTIITNFIISGSNGFWIGKIYLTNGGSINYLECGGIWTCRNAEVYVGDEITPSYFRWTCDDGISDRGCWDLYVKCALGNVFKKIKKKKKKSFESFS